MTSTALRRRTARITGRQSLGARGLLHAAWQAAVIALVLTTAATVVADLSMQRPAFMFDFRGDLYGAGSAILHGHDPYRLSFIESLAALKRAGGSPSSAFAVPVYPPPVLLAFTPFSLLPFWLDGIAFTILTCLAVVVGLRLLGVRDWRCHAVALGSYPAVVGIYLGTLSPWLLLAVGVAWRWRQRLWIPSSAITAAVVCKLFPWTLGVWLLATRRFRTFALALGLGVSVTLLAWAVIGFDGLTTYPRMLSALSFVEEKAGISPLGVFLEHGMASGIAKGVVLAMTATMLAVAWRVARRPDGDGRAFGLAIMAALTASPLVWPHYLILIFAPIALMSPQFSVLWLVPLLTCLSSPTPLASNWRQLVPWLAAEAIVVARLCKPRRGQVSGSEQARRPGPVSSGRWKMQQYTLGSGLWTRATRTLRP